ncbi:MAG: aminotransferase class I/II-fold pyridoxal phosphate-dependent enzyme [Planctomycetes bacterium]|nr:aminotransferase class I/II-fold pyridoxal phosphate-dependent enzyme [Planctomycetota bacterium]
MPLLMSPDDLCPRPDRLPPQPTEPLSPPIFLSAVYRCADPAQADSLLAGREAGFVYSRDGHPNAELLGEKCRQLHGAERAVICASGMAAVSAALLSQLQSGDHVVVSNQLYGRTLLLLAQETARLGIGSSVVDTCDLTRTAAAITPRTRLLVLETITNPLLRVSDLAAIAELAHGRGARLLVDNTFAGPVLCRPLEFGADLVMESLTKTMNGHSDVLLGLLCGRGDSWGRVPQVLSSWGFSAAPFECWLAARGLGTLALRIERACANALAAAEFLSRRAEVEAVHYPGLASHADHPLAARQFGGRFGTMVTFTLRGGLGAAERLIRAAKRIPFSPSLGDLCTTLSHPESTSHRGMTPEARAALGITGGTIRLSVGIESPEAVVDALREALG